MNIVWILLTPGERSCFAEDANTQVILLANGNLGRPQARLGSAFKPDKRLNIIVQSPPGDEGGEIG